MKYEDTQERFWSKVDKSGECWIWTAGKNPKGYGRFAAAPGLNVLAHRFSFELTTTQNAQGRCVCHHCDVPSCVKPEHLFLGTVADNNADKYRKGRASSRALHGEASPLSKLTTAEIIEIRRDYDYRGGGRKAAKDFGIAPSTVCNILRRKRWAHI